MKLENIKEMHVRSCIQLLKKRYGVEPLYYSPYKDGYLFEVKFEMPEGGIYMGNPIYYVSHTLLVSGCAYIASNPSNILDALSRKKPVPETKR